MTSRIDRDRLVSKTRSRFVMIPTSWSPSSTIGTPLIEYSDMSRVASLSVASGPRVIGLRIIPLSDRFTRSTCEHCASTDMFL